MIQLLLLLSLLHVIHGVCYSPKIHGFTPDVLLQGISSEILCPTPLVFDSFFCICVDPTLVTVRVPTEGRTTLELSLLPANPLSARLTASGTYRLGTVGLPDMHEPGQTHTWIPTASVTYRTTSQAVVPPFNPYGPGYNLPATSNILKAAAKVQLIKAGELAKQDVLDKMRWQEQLQRESAAVAAASSSPIQSVAVTALDEFMREALRRMLYGI